MSEITYKADRLTGAGFGDCGDCQQTVTLGDADRAGLVRVWAEGQRDWDEGEALSRGEPAPAVTMADYIARGEATLAACEV